MRGVARVPPVRHQARHHRFAAAVPRCAAVVDDGVAVVPRFAAGVIGIAAGGIGGIAAAAAVGGVEHLESGRQKPSYFVIL